jgi:hypothetical protein
MIYLTGDIVEKVWQEYLRNHDYQFGRSVYLNFKYIPARSILGQEFADWLYSQGAVVRRVNKNPKLEFSNDINATLFTMRWA